MLPTANCLAWLRRHAKAVVLATVAVGGLLLLILWIADRRAHSMTDDAFVESHIVNVAPEMVSGRIVRFLVDENDSVEQGQIIAEIDPEPYSDRVNIAQAKLDSAAAELKRAPKGFSPKPSMESAVSQYPMTGFSK